MKALVTGATGFLGRHACYRLQQMGWQVTGIGRNVAIGTQLSEQGIHFLQADLRDAATIQDSCKGIDIVFHCGAMSSPWGAARDFFDSNVSGTQHIVEGCKQHGVQRLIHISTPSIYFDYKQDRLNVTEQASLPLRPINSYAATKLQAEHVVQKAFAEGLPAIILRPRAIFGPYDSALLPRLMQANNGRGVPLIRGGQALVDLTYVDNVVDAMLLSCQASDAALGKAFNITNGEPIVLREALEMLFDMLHVELRTRPIPYRLASVLAMVMEWSHRLLPSLGEPPLTRYSVNVLARSQTLDISLARQLLGYQPRICLEDGLRRFAEWWSSNKHH